MIAELSDLLLKGGTMDGRILVYGDSRQGWGFPNEKSFQGYISDEIFRVNCGRHCYTQGKQTDVIVLSRKGLVYGRFEVDDVERPTPHDHTLYDRVKFVYIVRASALYSTLLRLDNFGIKGLRFGQFISEEKLAEIEKKAGTIREFRK